VATEGGNHLEMVATMLATPVTADEEPEIGSRTLAEAHRQRDCVRLQKDELDLARKRGELAPSARSTPW
jgi:hypothetical protein